MLAYFKNTVQSIRYSHMTIGDDMLVEPQSHCSAQTKQSSKEAKIARLVAQPVARLAKNCKCI